LGFEPSLDDLSAPIDVQHLQTLAALLRGLLQLVEHSVFACGERLERGHVAAAEGSEFFSQNGG
jgi:hypothetical protein